MIPLRWRDLAIGLSLANLCYLRIWSETLTYSRGNTFWMKHPSLPAGFAATIFNVIVVGVLLACCAAWARRTGGRAARFAEWCFLLFLVIPLNALRSVLSNQFDLLKSPLFDLIGLRGVLLLAIALPVAGVLAILKWRHALSVAAAAVLLALFPFVAVTFGQAVWKAAAYNPAPFVDKPLVPRLPQSKPGRILWIIFDEMDQRLAFDERHGVPMPEFDRFRGQALFAGNAHPPGAGTPLSMPGYITGRLVTWIVEQGPAELALTYRGERTSVLWSAQPNVFSDARAAGFNTALIGWYHPYCRVLNTSLVSCGWWEMASQYNSMGETFAEQAVNQPRSLFETNLFSLFGQSLCTLQQIHTYQAIRGRAFQAATDPGLGLILAHFPVPHGPHGYRRSTGDFTLRNSPINGYLDSLALVDRTLGELRGVMESAGLWDNTTILISADHPYREAMTLDGKMDPRIPFLMKLAGHTEGLTYDAPFNTVLTHDLLLAVLRGEVASPGAVAAWLDRHRTTVPVDANMP